MSSNNVYICITYVQYYVVLSVDVNRKSIMGWHNVCRDVCSDDLLHNPVVLGGPGHIVAIDETLVARRKSGNAQGPPWQE